MNNIENIEKILLSSFLLFYVLQINKFICIYLAYLDLAVFSVRSLHFFQADRQIGRQVNRNGQ